MNRNLIWKFSIVALLVVMCVLSVYPPGKKLKPGIDLAGGTSLLYQIDTTGMEEWEKRDIAQDMIRILQQRIDPGNKRNLIWRPHGSDRIEIQMPLATKETIVLLKAKREKFKALEKYNLNLRRVRQAMIQPAEKSQEEYRADRSTMLKELAGGSEKRMELLEQLTQAHDALMEGKTRRDAALEIKAALDDKLAKAEIIQSHADLLYKQWDNLDDPNRATRLKRLVGDDSEKKALVEQYIQIRRKISEARDAITKAEDGLEFKEEQAWNNLVQANIDLERLEKFLEAPKGKRRVETEQLKENHPDAAQLIDELISAYDAYAKVAGRLDDPEDLKRQLRGSGVLEFRILPLLDDGILSEGEIKNYQERLGRIGPKKASDDKYVWKKIKSLDEFAVPKAITGEFADDHYVLTSNLPDEILLHVTSGDIWRLQNARLDTDEIGNWAVAFGFNEIGARQFWNLTKNNLQRPLCILLDDDAISAPNIRTAIRNRGQITGRYSRLDAQDLVDKLNAGSLPARLGDQPISVNTIGPTMGHDNLIAGLEAGFYGLVAVAIFMLVYYMIAGSLANVALFLNLLLIIGVMAFCHATFTLPGIAGLILTIGMAVDANVLIFERIREEQRRGSSLRIAIKNGYDRAFRTIMDANATTFIVALILWIFASEEVKGFALILMIGIVSSMFTALFVTRIIFDFLTDRKILKKKMSMLQFVKRPQIDWLRMRPVFLSVSIFLVVGGWSVFLGRDEAKNSKYSIEFTGGTSIHVLLTADGADKMLSAEEKNKGITLREKVEQEIRNVGREIHNPLLAKAQVQRIGEADRHEFAIVTTETNQVKVTLNLSTNNQKKSDEIQNVLRQAAADIGDRRLESATVQPLHSSSNTFLMVTHQTNINKINQILKKVLPDATFTYETDEIVNNSVRKALSGKLDVLTDLSPIQVAGEPITDELITRKPYLSESKGGLYLKYNFDNNQTETLSRLGKRFEQSRYKIDFEKYGYNTFKWFSPDNATVAQDTPLNGIELAVESADVIYEGDQNEQWSNFTNNESKKLTEILKWQTSLPRVTQIDPSVGHKSINDALIAIVISLLAIVAYIWIRFGNMRFGMAAVVALVHDVSIAMGLVAASAWLATTPVGKLLLIKDFKIDLPMIAGFLTVIGYSLNDTIVVFDRIRENRGKLAILSRNIINDSINQTVSRTILTSMTTLIVLVVMYIWGGPGLRSFNYVMIIGVLVGTYSSIGIAVPLLFGAKSESGKRVKSTNNSKTKKK